MVLFSIRFYPSVVKKMIEEVLTERLTDKVYDSEVAGELSEELVRALRDAAKCKHPSTLVVISSRNTDV